LQFHSYGLFPKILRGVRFEVSLTRGGGSRKSPALDLYKYLYKFLFPYHFLSLPILPRSIVLLVLHNAMPPLEEA
jgi:hypothetical protein